MARGPPSCTGSAWRDTALLIVGTLLSLAQHSTPSVPPAVAAAPVTPGAPPNSFYRYHYHVRRLPPFLRNHLKRAQGGGGGGVGGGGGGGEGSSAVRAASIASSGDEAIVLRSSSSSSAAGGDGGSSSKGGALGGIGGGGGGAGPSAYERAQAAMAAAKARSSAWGKEMRGRGRNGKRRPWVDVSWTNHRPLAQVYEADWPASAAEAGMTADGGRGAGSGAWPFAEPRISPQTLRRQPPSSGLPCTPLTTAVIIPVNSEDDFARRLQYPSTITVVLELQNHILLTAPLLFNASFACTVLRSAARPARGFQLTLMRTDAPLLWIAGASNVLVLRVSFFQPYAIDTAACQGIPYMGTDVICPAIHIYQAANVQVARGTVYGRIDVYWSVAVRVDGMKVTGLGDFKRGQGLIRVAFCGHGPTMQRSQVVISNNEVFGARFPIVLYFGAVGVTVSNNYVHDFIFAGIVCGAFVSYVGDCMLSTISNNLVVATGRNISGDMDASGIYFNTHWFNPGNLAECNYVIGGDQCYYLDFASSGVTIRGGACIDTYAGMKVNNGKSNVIEDVVVKNTRWTPGWSTCLTAEVVNCGKKPGSYWEQMRRKYYNSAQINQNWPWMQTVCSEMGVNGVPCNSNARGTLNATLTGKCSGLPTRNSLMLVLVGALDYDMDFKYCEDLPNTPRINSHRYINVTNVADAQFLDFVEDDLGVKKGSSLYKTRPNFKSCPRSEVGPKKLLERSYYENFNKAIPDVYYVTLGVARMCAPPRQVAREVPERHLS
ncbi:unnamed protein product [Closterium sp. Naga37s-1]|nr:unnamed protein product [Closterium sp. Naga37s-1]